MDLAPLMKGAMIAVRDCMGVKVGESVLVVTDTGKLKLAESFVLALHTLGVDGTLLIMTPRSHHAEEPPREVKAALSACDVALLVTTMSLTHTHARMEATAKGVRIASMPGLTEDMMTVGAMTADYQEVSELSWKLTRLMEKTRMVEITTDKGTNLRMSLEGRKPGLPPDDGLYREKGRWGNLPAGEVYIAPVEESVEGVAVIDGSMSPMGLLSEPIRLTIRRGRVVEIQGGKEAQALSNFLENLGDPNAYVVGELGIGTNHKARVTGNILEDEKAFRTVHIALGMNVDMGGVIESKTHNDGIICNPTVKFDGTMVMNEGIFTL
ncbi:MAG: aminopeptidase [Candidatus Atribacteria bacterium]|nr:aminopeptidase [Candidatus Atribacteria bacterium]